MAQTIKIKYIHSPSGRPEKQKETVRCLGLSRLGQVRDVPDSPSVRGMVKKIPHLVKIIKE